MLCDDPPPPPAIPQENKTLSPSPLPRLQNLFARSRTPSPEPMLTPLPSPPAPRRMVVVAVGIKPHRKLWTTSARPGESVIRYVLMNGCPAVVLPVQTGSPLLAWHALTLEELWKVALPPDERADEEQVASVDAVEENAFAGVVGVLCEYLELSVDWARVKAPDGGDPRVAVRHAVMLLVAAAVQSGQSEQVKKEIDKERSGIAMWRIP